MVWLVCGMVFSSESSASAMVWLSSEGGEYTQCIKASLTVKESIYCEGRESSLGR